MQANALTIIQFYTAFARLHAAGNLQKFSTNGKPS